VWDPVSGCPHQKSRLLLKPEVGLRWGLDPLLGTIFWNVCRKVSEELGADPQQVTLLGTIFWNLRRKVSEEPGADP